MTLIYSVDNLPAFEGNPETLIGGKGVTLLKLYSAGLAVPKPICITTRGYDLFVEENGLREKINLELHRKELKDMRWEEIWDISLRIQNFFLTGDIPDELCHQIKNGVHEQFGDAPLAVRSSAPDEDNAMRSFAGLHESYLNIVGIEELLKKIKKVWASLWSDRAILYRQELNLQIESSTMAVVVQEFLEGATSGVLFTKNPLDSSTMIVEAVYGLNQGLVDGDIEPDRWVLDRKGPALLQHNTPANRDFQFARSPRAGIQRRELNPNLRTIAPLTAKQVEKIAGKGLELENFFDSSQDIEWTVLDDRFYILQSRPITTESGIDSNDKRSWYLSLNRSYENLLKLWKDITEDLLPKMDRDSEKLAEMVLENLSDSELAGELVQRSDINDRWVKIYWSDFIPFAHGVRLFGELYNDVMEPDDPFEFVALLTGQEMLSTERNEILSDCATMVRSDDSLRHVLQQGKFEFISNDKFLKKLARLKSVFSMAGIAGGEDESSHLLIASVILQYASLEVLPRKRSQKDTQQLEAQFFRKSVGKLPMEPKQLLQLARSSYRIRDNDNMHIGRIDQELQRAAAIARHRITGRGLEATVETPIGELATLLRGGSTKPNRQPARTAENKHPHGKVYARQLLGQAASRGIAKGKARVVEEAAELKYFENGEILVIDSIDPTMTFFAPLAAGIVERRGGMLIHGAIIAREYGIPCITGVSEATSYIHTGDVVTVDGYLGICTIQRQKQ